MAETDYYGGCSFISVSPLHDTTVKAREVTETQRDLIFGEAFSRIEERDATETASLLKRLEELSPSTAACFESKAKQTRNFVFRLICPNKKLHLEGKSSYVAISYRWRQQASSTQIILNSSKPDDTGDERVFTALPVPGIFQAAILQLFNSTSEGLWCDQICIDQNNGEEKAISIGLMDLIYQEARCVIILLDDVRITKAEQAFLESYIPEYLSLARPPEDGWTVPHEFSNPPYMESHPILYEILIKILQCEWFGRAWCSHEMYMGRRHLFLASCEGEGTILRFSGQFLVDLCILYFKTSNLPSLQGKLRLSVFMTTISGIMVSNAIQDNNLLKRFHEVRDLITSGDPLLFGPPRERSALRDKMAITLNVAKCNIVLNHDRYVKIEGKEENFGVDSWYTMSLLALAAKDPIILCTTGEPLALQETSKKRYSWLRHYSTRDRPPQTGGDLPTFESLTFFPNSENIDEYIDIMLTGFDQSSMMNDPSKAAISLAMEFIKSTDHTSSYAVQQWYDWRIFVKYSEEARRCFILTVACLLENGVSWILSYLNFTLSTFDFIKKLRATLEQHIILGLPSCDLSASTEVVANTVAEWMETVPGSSEAASLVLQLAKYLLTDALPTWTADSFEEYQPCVLSIASKKYIIFRNPRISLPNMVIPQALLRNEYSDLNILWFIEFVEVNGNAEWTLMDKRKIYGPSICDQMKVERRLKIFGPPIEPSSLNS